MRLNAKSQRHNEPTSRRYRDTPTDPSIHDSFTKPGPLHACNAMHAYSMRQWAARVPRAALPLHATRGGEMGDRSINLSRPAGARPGSESEPSRLIGTHMAAHDLATHTTVIVAHLRALHHAIMLCMHAMGHASRSFFLCSALGGAGPRPRAAPRKIWAISGPVFYDPRPHGRTNKCLVFPPACTSHD